MPHVSEQKPSDDEPAPLTHEQLIEAERELDEGLREAFAGEGVDRSWARRSTVVANEAVSRAGLRAAVTCRSRHCEIRPEIADPEAAEAALEALMLDGALSAEFSQIRNTGDEDESDGRFAPVWFLERKVPKK
jgi:hypothetical protein